jgi:hypothetical protein
MRITVYGDGVDANNIENALANRGLLRDDDLYLGWSDAPAQIRKSYLRAAHITRLTLS